jgi:hypothetical protein
VVRLGLCIVIFPRFLKDYCDGVLEVYRIVALFKACVKELKKTRKEDFKYLIKNTVADAVCAGGLI